VLGNKKMNKCVIDHITITTPTLEAGAKLVKSSLGVNPQEGGEHPRMGTHNLLLRLGDSTFLEVIACNTVSEKPNRPRWFALDDINMDTPAELKTWVVRTKDIHSTLEACSESVGEIESMSRGKTNWLITIPKDGSLPINEGAPALIQWQVESHPANKLIDYGLSLIKLQIYNPEAERISKFLKSIEFSGNIEVLKSKESRIIASINTPKGICKLHA
jgi:hypothetical protein